MHSDADTVQAYLASLPPDRRAALEAVRETILANLQPGFDEAMNWGMITYEVPLSTNAEDAARFEAAYKATGKRYDVGKSCVRFKKLDDLPLELIGEQIAKYDAEAFVAAHKAARG